MSVAKSLKKFIELPEKKNFFILILQSIPFILKDLILTGKTELKIVWDDPKKIKKVKNSSRPLR